MPRKRKHDDSTQPPPPAEEPEELDIISFISMRGRRKTSNKSILSRLIPLEEEPAILIYGPSKTGKTRLAAWEGAALGSVLNRRLLIILTESNVEDSDFADLLSICMHHNVHCEIVKLDHLQGIRKYIRKFTTTITRTARKTQEELEMMPRVVVLDSLTALSELVTSSLSDGLLENPQTLIAYQNPFQIAVVDPIRRVLSTHILNGYLIVTAHETQTRGEPYNPAVPRVKAKPRYASAGRYKEDVEVYFTNDVKEFDDMFQCAAGKDAMKKENRKYARVLVVVRARRHPDAEGKALSIVFERVEGEAVGSLSIESVAGSVTYSFTPADMAGDAPVKRFRYNAIVPVPLCGPRKV